MEKKKPSSSFSYNFKRSPSPPQVTDGEYISKTSVSTPEEQVFAVDHLTDESGGGKVVSPSLDSLPRISLRRILGSKRRAAAKVKRERLFLLHAKLDCIDPPKCTPEEQVFAVDHLTGESGGSKVVSPSLDSRIARLKSRATGKKVAKSFHFPDIPVTTPVVEGPASRKTKPKPKPTFKSPWLPQGRGEYIILFYLYYINII